MSILLDVENLANSCINDEIEREFMINGLIDILVRIPTCTATERMFLDEIREKGWWVDEEEGKGIELPQESFLSQDDFKTPLNELIK